MTDSVATVSFEELGLAPHLVSRLKEIGYEAPTPIQQQSIPILLSGSSLLGQAQTGTGKTGAFALPLLSNVDTANRSPQVLVLTPTRELALQVAEAFQTYARNFKNFHVLPIYGGQSISNQLHQLRRGAQVIVGTPGRVMDHLRRKSLDLSAIKCVVLDEADEMLNMGFVEDIELILEHTPENKQVALFSATMPDGIKRIARKHLKGAQEVKIHAQTATVESTSQYYWQVSGLHKLDALTRILEVQEFDAALIFVRTKTATVELADKLEARGYSCTALSGDLNQAQRERAVEQLKKGTLDIIVATDVAARGLDVDRISLVVNYDIPYDAQSYVHRIGRTGRAGRRGTAILFVSPRERHLLRSIERMTRQPIEALRLPSKKDLSDRRVQRFKDDITTIIREQDLALYSNIVEELALEKQCSTTAIASALCFLTQKTSPFIIEETAMPREEQPARGEKSGGRSFGGRSARSGGGKRHRGARRERAPRGHSGRS